MRYPFLPLASLASLTLLFGCGIGVLAVPNAVPGAALTGTVHGGQQPVTGSHVYVMQATKAGYGNASTSLVTNGDGTDSYGGYVLTGAGGNFSLTGKYACVPNTQVYIVALGGNPGLAAGTNNAALSLMANLGNCPALGTLAAQVPNVNLDEVTTVASVYAIAGYMTGTFQASSSPTPLAATGMANAFSTTGNLTNLATGLSYTTTPGGNGTVPQAMINTLANMMAACVNTNGAVTPPSGSGNTAVAASPCYTLFSNAKNGTISPTDTVSAVLNIAHNPGAHVSALYGLVSGSVPFQPTLASAPKDFTISVTYKVPGMGNPLANATHPHNVSIDASGNVWSANDQNNTLGVANTLGVPVSGAAGYSGNGMSAPGSVAVDNAGQVYVTNAGASTVSVFTSAGTPRLLTPILTAGLHPKDAAVDINSNVWITNGGGSSVSEFSNTGVSAANSPFTGNGLSSPAGIAIDPNGNVWIADSGSKEVLAFTTAGAPLSGSPFSFPNEVIPFGIAIDGTADIWTTDQSTGTFVTDSQGAPILLNPFYANNTYSNAVAIDGAGQAWITDRNLSCLNVLNATGAILSGISGYSTGGLGADSIAIDGSGNVWFTPINPTTLASDNTIREMIGAAAPVVTPIAAGIAGNTLATRP
jgi:streptogramin lyase